MAAAGGQLHSFNRCQELNRNFMKTFILFFLLCLPSFATIRCVGSSPSGVACEVSYTPANPTNLQAGLNALGCGDTLYIQAGVTYVGSFAFHGVDCSAAAAITVTSNKPAFLPGPNTRATPSDLPNMPNLQYAGSNQLILYSDALASATHLGSRVVPKNWYFIGLAFTLAAQSTPDCNVNSLACSQGSTIGTVGGGLASPQNDYIQNPSELPQNIWFDRCLFLGPQDNSASIQSMLHLNCGNCGLINSFMQDNYLQGSEGHGVFIGIGGPVLVQNNFIDAGGIPFFSGGVTPDYLGATVSNETTQYNFFTKELKWWINSYNGSTTANPHPEWFLANGSKSPCHKNLYEHKYIQDSVIQYNVLQNAWADDFCTGQPGYGITETPRTYRDSSDSGSVTGILMGTITTSGSSFSINYGTWGPYVGFYNTTYHDVVHSMLPDQGICLYNVSQTNLIECQTVATFNGTVTPYTGTTTSPWSVNVTKANWHWIMDPYPIWRNVTVQNNLFREVNTPFQTLPRDTSNLTSNTNDAGRMVNVVNRNNLTIKTLNISGAGSMIHGASGDSYGYYNNDPTVGMKGYVLDHNSMLSRFLAYDGILWSCDGAGGNTTLAYPACSGMDNPQFTNNVFPEAVYQISTNGLCAAIWDLGCLTNLWGITGRLGKIAHNYGSGYGCTGPTCSGNVFTGLLTYMPNSYKAAPSSAAYRAASDGTDIGPNPGFIPMINNLHVTVSQHSALLEFDLTAPIQDAGNTQPCAIEVSPTVHATQVNGYPTIYSLPSDLSAYVPTNDINPAFFKQATSTNRTNPLLLSPVVSAGHVAFPIGQNSTVTGDDGITHSLALSPTTVYQGRAQCYGDTQYFSFTTAAVASALTALPFRLTPPSGVASVQLDYGVTAVLGSSITGVAGADGSVTLTIPVRGGVPVYSRITYKNSAGTVVYRSAVQIMLP